MSNNMTWKRIFRVHTNKSHHFTAWGNPPPPPVCLSKLQLTLYVEVKPKSNVPIECQWEKDECLSRLIVTSQFTARPDLLSASYLFPIGNIQIVVLNHLNVAIIRFKHRRKCSCETHCRHILFWRHACHPVIHSLPAHLQSGGGLLCELSEQRAPVLHCSCDVLQGIGGLL